MKISIFGTGYVGLVTGVCLSHIGHEVTCIDIDKEKIEKMKKGISPMYEPGLDELMATNINERRLHFTTDCKKGLENAEVIYIAVGTPQRSDGSADLKYIEQVALNIAKNLTNDAVIVVKSTVPVGTNNYVKSVIEANLIKNVHISMVSNPEFLREGSAIHDSLKGDRIVIGTEERDAADIMQSVNQAFNIPIFKTDIKSAEMIKYASNAFLATKISFINEISTICEKLDANIEQVAEGMGLDQRIGPQFLKAGIGYGGSCFPKDTQALVQMAGNIQHDFDLLKSVIDINNKQKSYLIEKANQTLGSLKNKNIGILGLSFKPNTDDMREAASIVIIQQLIKEGMNIKVYDPIAMENAREVLPSQVKYVNSIDQAIQDTDLVFIVTEWDEIRNYPLEKYTHFMKEAIIFDGRNCYDLEIVKQFEIDYYSVGRPSIIKEKILI
ncbi:UDP-glucose/GDP-mannose dehydrogenase family protein [Bacillus thuringiensis]|uniref:UDP-glucose dehydrogenase family protein n=1 Tax=Bacillus cereus group TaxID=86661 RepID=UPI0003303997|nr:UDP-glucose/GDP-mannose dehydrogenase family protein [Bacillus cereus]EOQ02678.1 nucleotide sugar dehydrogenase [Bacillus cereus VD140]MDF9536109.1 UDP-glucose/GDP-mannose dehydrogenase family protein [Bacillus cereus]